MGDKMSVGFMASAMGVLSAMGVMGVLSAAGAEGRGLFVDYRYAPDGNVSTPAFPDDRCKTLVGPRGQLLYDCRRGAKLFNYANGCGFRTVIHMLADEDQRFLSQRLHSARVPVPVTLSSLCGMEVRQEVYSTAGALREGKRLAHPLQSDREDILLTAVKNTTSARRTISPVIVVNAADKVEVRGREIAVGGKHFGFSLPAARVRRNLAPSKTVVELAPVTLAPGEERLLAGVYDNGMKSGLSAALAADPGKFLDGLPGICGQVVAFWERGSGLPYGRIRVPDREIQNLTDASIRGIWQAREIVDGGIRFQVGPTCYRGLWIADGAFLTEAAALLGRGRDARGCIAHILSLQRGDGRFDTKTVHTFHKENGIVLWTAVRHARLTQDKEWLRSVWPALSKTAAYIRALRRRSFENKFPQDDGLIPPGYIDGGLAGGVDKPEYSNTLWCLAGLKSMIAAAKWIGAEEDAGKWQAEYDDFFGAFRKAACRDLAKDGFGNRYLNNMMLPRHRGLPQRAQWAFCQSVYPGQIFAADDPIAVGTMNMLHTTLQEGMVMGTGWVADGIWSYFASFYGHACLWTGEPGRAAAALYAFANHASPLYAWREEQNPRDLQRHLHGDMPHNWASAEFIRLVVHLLQIDRGRDLHLLEGMPREWLKAGMLTSLRGVATPFGPLSFSVRVGPDGRTAQMEIEPLEDKSCRGLVVHTGGWGTVNGSDAARLEPGRRNRLTITMDASGPGE